MSDGPTAGETRPLGTHLQSEIKRALGQAAAGDRLSERGAAALAEFDDVATLTALARASRDRGHGSVVSYSPKVFIPLTRLCRDVCHYCTFAHPPKKHEAGFLSIEAMVALAARGAEAGCHEALFTLGDKPELRYETAAGQLAALGHETTLSYLVQAAGEVHARTGLLPHLNAGVLDPEDIAKLRRVSVSAGLMLENVSPRLCDKGGPHHGSPDKQPAVRIRTLRHAGELRVPFTTGILVGIGETRLERIQSLLVVRDLQDAYGHIQEVIVQNFSPKPNTRMADAPPPTASDFIWTVAVARLILGPEMNIQAPPNLSRRHLRQLLDAGINDWGGISPVTKDHVNPEAPWPTIEELRQAADGAGKILTPRLAMYPSYATDPDKWLDPAFVSTVTRRIDSQGFLRDPGWAAGQSSSPPPIGESGPHLRKSSPIGRDLASVLHAARDGKRLSTESVVRLFQARGAELHAVCAAADELRSEMNGDAVTYVVNRNINYTNVCSFRCGFCAFSKGRLSRNLRGRPYNLDLEEVARRTREAWERGATEVCLQGGIHPDYSGETYLRLCGAVKDSSPHIHLHAFSPLEVWHGARTLELTVQQFLTQLKAAGLNSLPGTAAEILDDEIRSIICPDKLTADQWLDVVGTAHDLGLATTSTIMFGHVDNPIHWARHLLQLRDLQSRTRGFTEIVPLPFVHMEAPIYLRGRARPGPTFRETVLMHAVARLALHPEITNVQVSWVKLGEQGAQACLAAGANDLGGTLMNESISRAAGAAFGQELSPQKMEALIAAIGRTPRQRTTLYRDAPSERRKASFGAAPLSRVVERPVRKETHGQATSASSKGL